MTLWLLVVGCCIDDVLVVAHFLVRKSPAPVFVHVLRDSAVLDLGSHALLILLPDDFVVCRTGLFVDLVC